MVPIAAADSRSTGQGLAPIRHGSYACVPVLTKAVITAILLALVGSTLAGVLAL